MDGLFSRSDDEKLKKIVLDYFSPRTSDEFFFSACSMNRPVILELLIELKANVNPGSKYYPILYNRSNLEIARPLIKAKVDITVRDIDKRGVLHGCNNVEVAKLFIQEGADVNLRDRFGRTPLFYCFDFETAKLLIEHKAEINKKDFRDYTPVFFCKNAEVLKLFIQKKADLNIKAYRNETPLSKQKLRSLSLILKEAGAK